MVRLAERLARSRRNPLDRPLREVRVRIDTGKILRIVSNDLEAPAQELADLYKNDHISSIKQTLAPAITPQR